MHNTGYISKWYVYKNMINKANLKDLRAVIGLVILFGVYDFEIGWLTEKN